MIQSSADRNLLFGILALQMDFINRDALIRAMHAWVLEKAKPLGQILLDQEALRKDAHDLLEAMVQKHLEMHGNNPEQSLAAVSSAHSVREELKQIADPDVQASLAHVSISKGKEESYLHTSPPSMGTATSSGQRFRILRPHARGGLGEVFVACDEEFRREVALKEIQDRFADQPENRSRFLLEAEITGGLEHPGIVPVYGLGQYGDGRPFYAMRFIKGDSLKEAIEQFHKAERAGRDPGTRGLELRQLLRRFLDVCNAIAYAHSRGVLHRDLKPGNIMLGQYGETLVVDWGLAKPLDMADARAESVEQPLLPSLSSGTAETVAGSAIGTPQFMSPEQAAGRHDLLGSASDIYSLGATLYCLLTGRPPFSDTREVGLAEVLHKVQRGEFPPPGQVKPDIPPTLEAICLKAMALRPGDRFGSPRALADDIDHWLADEPVSCYREPLRARVGRWARHHKALVSSTAMALVTAVVVLGIATLLIDRARRGEARQKNLAETAGRQADKNARAEADARGEADQQAHRAEENFRQARKAVDEILTRVGQERLALEPRMEKVRRDLLEQALQFYEQFLLTRGDDAPVYWETGRAAQRLGDIQEMLGQHDRAEAAYGRARALFVRLIANSPDDPDYGEDLATTHNNLGNLLKEAGRYQEAAPVYREALALRKELTRKYPDEPRYRQELAGTLNNLSLLLEVQTQLPEAEADQRQAIDLQQQLVTAFPDRAEYRQELARGFDNLGKLLLKDATRLQEAEKAFRQALDLFRKLAAQDATVPEYRQELAICSTDLGTLLRDTRPGEAEEAYRQALKLQEDLTADYPYVPVFRQEQAATSHNLGILLLASGRQEEAEQAEGRSLAVKKKLVDDFPGRPEYQRDLAAGYSVRGIELQTHNQVPEAEDAFRRAVDLYSGLAAAVPGLPDDRQELARARVSLGTLFISRRPPEAEKAFRQALIEQEQLVTQFPMVTDYRQEWARTYIALGTVLQLENHLQEAESAYRKGLDLDLQLVDKSPGVPDYQFELAGAYNNLGELLRVTNRLQEAEQAWGQAVDRFQKLAKDQPTIPAYRQGLAGTCTNLGVLLTGLHRIAQAEESLREAINLRQKLVDEFPPEPVYRQGLALSWNNLGTLLAGAGQSAKAEEAFRQALALQEKLVEGFPDVATYRLELTQSYHNLTALETAAGRVQEAEQEWRRLLSLQEKLAAKLPDDPDSQRDLAATQDELAGVLVQEAKWAEARQLVQQGIQHQRAAPKGDPNDPSARKALLVSYGTWADIELRQGNHGEAAKVAEQLTGDTASGWEEHYQAAAWLARCMPLAEKDDKLEEPQRKAAAQAYADRAVTHLREAVARGFQNVEHLKTAPELEPLRSHDGFRKLVAEMEGKTKTGAR